MAKAKQSEEPEEIKPEVVKSKKVEFEETEDLAKAENLQKSGWLLESIRLTPNGKKYKFKREK